LFKKKRGNSDPVIMNFVTKREKILPERPEKKEGRKKSKPQRTKQKLDTYHQEKEEEN
tara:strand:- start:215 stop:388 length:174 start_codon:yes stop_codon:yes gene_type:complete